MARAARRQVLDAPCIMRRRSRSRPELDEERPLWRERRIKRARREWKGVFLAWRFCRVFPRFGHAQIIPTLLVKGENCAVERRWNIGGVSVEYGARGCYRTSTAQRTARDTH